MKSLLVLLGLCLVLSFSGCGDEESIEATSLVTFKVDPLVVASEDDWIIIYDSNGKLLTQSEYHPGDELQLQTDKKVTGSTLGVTFLSLKTIGGVKNFTLYTYLNVEIGRAIYLKPVHINTTNSIGVTVTVNNYPTVHSISLSGRFGIQSYSEEDNTVNHSFKIGSSIETGEDKFLVEMSDDEGNLKYKMFDGVVSGQNLSVDYSELLDFDQVVEFTFPTSNGVIMIANGKDAATPSNRQGYATSFHVFPSHAHSSWKVGYLNSLSRYRTSLYLVYTGYTYSYINIGSIPSGTIEWPTPGDYTVNNSTITGFSASVPATLKFRQSHWSFNSPADNAQGSWHIYSPSASQTFSLEFPEELITKYPSFHFDQFSYDRSDFSTGTRTYQDLLSEKLDEVYTNADNSGMQLTISF